MTTDEIAAPLPDVASAERSFREVNGVTLHVAAAGAPGDPLVVFLHGFPEFWYEWHEYIAPFVEAGYRVLIPDQRGYNRSDKPIGTRSYRISELSRDVVELIESEGRDSAHVVAHDWGGGVAWDLSLRHPDRLDRLGIVNSPHPSVFRETLRSSPRQLLRSWYVLLFQLPAIPEWVASIDDYEPLVSSMRDQTGEGTFAGTDFDRYRTAWAAEGALTGMINWYRAAARHSESPPRERVEAPTQIVWGEDDEALVPEMAPLSLDYCADSDLERFPGASHWVLHEYPDLVADIVLDHLGR